MFLGNRQFGLDLTWTQSAEGRGVKGQGILWVGLEPHWHKGHRRAPTPITWTWYQLAKRIDTMWPHLVKETESFPDRADKLAYADFARKHDLSYHLQGIFASPLLIRRAINTVYFKANDEVTNMPLQTAFLILHEIAVHIYEYTGFHEEAKAFMKRHKVPRPTWY